MVKTGSRFVCLLFFILFGHVFCAENTVYAENGKSYTFKPQITGTIESILWKRNNDKVVESDDTLTWFQFKGQGDLNNKTGELTLHGVHNKTHYGIYESEIQVNKKLQYSKHNLQVIDGVSIPKITCDVSSEGKITLLCSERNSEPPEFKWSGPDNLTQEGVMLTISKETRPESVYFCTVKNKVSEKSQQISLRECYPDGVHPGVIAACVLVPLTILGILGVVFWGKIKEFLPVPNN